jgi:ATP-dependent helicase Lhr and Lhr-like helicase
MVALFHPIIQDWFASRFEAPTEPQARGWPHIAAGEPTLIAAPTGSGKTLTAFLAVIDRLFRESADGRLTEGVQVVYVSPLRALSNDMHRNLEVPLAEILDAARAAGLEFPASAVRTELPTHGATNIGAEAPDKPRKGPPIRVGLRTGDTPAHRRTAMLKRPPHILVTTPESLYLMLTSPKSREILRTVETVIVDEIHALVRDKRGSHLALSLERLEALTGRPLQRIGLSATQKPIERMAEFLVGDRQPDSSFRTGERLRSDESRKCTIIDVGHARELDLGIEIPSSPLEAVCSHEHWDEVYERIIELINAHRSTLIFVNTRRMAERVTHQLTQRLGEEAVGSHHGSLSKELRHATEQKLKNGDLKAVVATSSLELGIDVGYIDLVIQIGSPRAVAAFLQRIGRSGHALGLTPKGRLFALTRDELVECLALIRAVRQGRLDVTPIPEAPLDILAQQIVAELACREWNADDLFTCFTRAWPYRDLERREFDRVLEILSGGFCDSSLRTTNCGMRSDESPDDTHADLPSPPSPLRRLIYHDRINGRLTGRRGARLAALNNGGAIGEVDSVRVLLEEEGVVVGSVDEDFAVESMAGDIFLLGNSSWRIRRLRGNDLIVSDAQGAPPTIPFWRGEAPGRTIELSEEISRLREEIETRLIESDRNSPEVDSSLRADSSLRTEDLRNDESKRDPVIDWLIGETGCSRGAADQVVEYMAAQRGAIGLLPTQKRIVFERFFDESGGMQLVVHAPFGGRINRGWGLAFRKRFCRSFDFELQASADDDGFILSLGPQHSFPIESLFPMLRTDNVRNLLEQALLAVPMFHLRWRWNVTRALFMDRMRNGKKVPPALQRFRAEDLLTAVFPKLTGCQENITGDHEIPDHPLVQQTVADCLFEAMDIDGLTDVLGRIESGELTLIARDTREPSPFAYELLNANPYAFLDGGEIQERRARAVATRRSVCVTDVSDLGRLDPQAIDDVVREAQPDIRNADELHELLLNRILLPIDDSSFHSGENLRNDESSELTAIPSLLTVPPDAHADLFKTLLADGRAVRVNYTGNKHGWVATERVSVVRALYPDSSLCTGNLRTDASGERTDASGERPAALVALLRGWVETCGPVTAEELATLLELPIHHVFAALEAIEGEGLVLRGRFRQSREPRAEGQGDRHRETHTPDAAPLALGPQPSAEWCHRRLLARIHRRTVAGLRREIEAVDLATFQRFLFRHQGVVPGHRYQGSDGVHAVIAQLQGLDVAAAAWEQAILPLRVEGPPRSEHRESRTGSTQRSTLNAQRSDGPPRTVGSERPLRSDRGAGAEALTRPREGYQPVWLDELCLSGEVGWGRLEPKQRSGKSGRPMASMTRAIPVSLFLREDLSWLATRVPVPDFDPLSSPARQVLELLQSGGALFASDLLQRTQMLPSQLDDVLGELVSFGLVTSDLFAGLRGLIHSPAQERPKRPRPRGMRPRQPPRSVGRWTILSGGRGEEGRGAEEQRGKGEGGSTAGDGEALTNDKSPIPNDKSFPPSPGPPVPSSPLPLLPSSPLPSPCLLDEWAWQLIRRWGVVFRELVLREPLAPPWWELLRVYRRLEARGELRGGRFIRSVGGEQFATSEAVRELRELRNETETRELVILSAADPLNLTGILGPGARIPAVTGNQVAYLNGELVGWKKGPLRGAGSKSVNAPVTADEKGEAPSGGADSESPDGPVTENVWIKPDLEPELRKTLALNWGLSTGSAASDETPEHGDRKTGPRKRRSRSGIPRPFPF